MTQPLFTDQLPTALYTAAQVRELDRLTIASGIPGFNLMTLAGQAAFSLMCNQWPQAKRCIVLCGSGNNGGDGYVVARLAHQHGMQVHVWAVTPPERLTGDARLAYESARDAGVSVAMDSDAANIDAAIFGGSLHDATPLDTDIIVDAVLGTGLQGEVKAAARAAIERINLSSAPVLAIDIPSGLCADSGQVLGVAVKASVTITFIGMKIGLLLAAGKIQAGKVFFADLQVPASIRSQAPVAMQHVTASTVYAQLPARARDAHKGHFGHVLVIGGDLGMGGAVLMAAEAASRTGAGLTSVLTRPEHVSACLARRPEIMVHPVSDNAHIEPRLDAATVIVIGPGLGRSAWGENLFRQAFAAGKPMVIDADGLHWLATLMTESPGALQQGQWVLTPHPGEAARLLQTPLLQTSLLQITAQKLQSDRINAVSALQARYGGVAVLKGAGTLICDQNQQVSLATVGNPGMATGGMGDVLSGIVGGLLAQGLSLPVAATCGVWLHGMAADHAAKTGERGLLATDLFGPLRQLVNPFSVELNA